VENLTYAHPQSAVNPMFMRVSADEHVKKMWINVDKPNNPVNNSRRTEAVSYYYMPVTG